MLYVRLSALTLSGDVTCHHGGGSGGYLEHVVRYAAKILFGLKLDEIQYTVLR